jgi:predicted RNase H-like nuclease (RuvC/YqgF family)
LRSSNLNPIAPPLPPGPEVEDLLDALNREQGLRKAAEARLSKTSEEVEELSAALFEQANEMVAEERRARARLEERVEVLEKREKDKKRRLDRLESAVETIRRARAVLDSDGLGIVVRAEKSEAVVSADVDPEELRS